MIQEDCIIENSLEAHALAPKESLLPTKPFISSTANSTPYKNLIFVSIISNEKIPVFLVYIKENDQYCAMKIFPITDTKRNYRYKNEIRFTAFSHPNVIKTVYHEHNRIIASGSISFRASFILTEFAPYGDFFDFVTTYHNFFSEKLIRTYFRQLIEGLEYLHKEKVGHLDLKLENLFLGTDFVLKIGDFDLSCSLTDKIIVSHGTQNYRAPEVLSRECVDAQAADIYSAGIVLFVMMSGGIIPYAENTSSSEINLFEMLQNNNKEFWEQQCKLQKRSSSYFSSEFKELFHGMIRAEPRERLTIKEIKNSNWYNGPVLSQEQITKFLEPIVELKHLME